MRKLALAIVVAASTFGALAVPAFASARRACMVCDDAQSPDYDIEDSHPHNCNLGLDRPDTFGGAVYYQVRPVPGRSFVALALRRLHWQRWGGQQAIAHGLACNVYDDGSADWSSCDHVEVDTYSPVKIGPAGFVPIYQRTRVLHRPTRSEPYQYGYWYQPGTDY